jgi:hypothetical protein
MSYLTGGTGAPIKIAFGHKDEMTDLLKNVLDP